MTYKKFTEAKLLKVALTELFGYTANAAEFCISGDYFLMEQCGIVIDTDRTVFYSSYTSNRYFTSLHLIVHDEDIEFFVIRDDSIYIQLNNEINYIELSI